MTGSIDPSAAVTVMVGGSKTGRPLDREVAKPVSCRLAVGEKIGAP